MTVPAHRFLWSARDDDAAGHLRRYSRRRLRQVLRAAGLLVERIFGFQCLLLPLATLARVTARVRGDAKAPDREDRPPRWANRALGGINRLELALGRVWRPPTGTSLVAVARRPRPGPPMGLAHVEPR